MNPASNINRDGADVAKLFMKILIEENWKEVFIGTRRIHRFRTTVEFPKTSLAGMSLKFSYNHIEAVYEGETYVIDFEADRRTGDISNILFSSNWNNRPLVLIEVHRTFQRHIVHLSSAGLT